LSVAPATHPILVIEDDPDLCLLLATALELDGWPVVTASTGLEAFNLARLHHPSLIVLDLMLPVMSGEEFRAAQLADETLESIPVLVVSARHDAKKVAERIGAVGCLIKPVDVDAFSALVKTLVPLQN
jgi:DNA-binding response OmpR family regulator